MKTKLIWATLTLALISGLFVFNPQAKSGSPFPPWIYSYFGNQLPVASGIDVPRRAHAIFDVSTGGHTATGTYGLGVFLPAKAIIMRSWLYTVTLSSGSTAPLSTIAIQCEDANNIKTATNLTNSSADTFIEGESTGAVSAAKTSIASPCEISAVVATGVMSTGKWDIYIDYDIHE